MKKILSAALAGGLAAALAACSPVSAALGLGAATGVAAAQEGGIPRVVSDKAIYLKVSDLWLKKSFEMYRKLTLTVKEGRVLVAGVLPTPQMRVDAIRLAWQAEGVTQVINEVKIANEGSGFSDYVTDTWISGNVKAKILFDKHVQSINYTIDAVSGTVYVMGIAQNQQELNHVLDAARTTRYVKNVVSYARLRGQTPAGLIDPTKGRPPVYPDEAPAHSYAPSAQEDSSFSPGAGYTNGEANSPTPLTEPAPVQQESLSPAR